MTLKKAVLAYRDWHFTLICLEEFEKVVRENRNNPRLAANIMRLRQRMEKALGWETTE